jgi:hypothetical protein
MEILFKEPFHFFVIFYLALFIQKQVPFVQLKILDLDAEAAESGNNFV